MTAERNTYENMAFGEGRVGHIQMRSGGEQATKPEDTIVVNEAGILMHHGDEFDSITFIPITNVAWVRTRAIARKKVNSGRELPMPERASLEVVHDD